jgi:precorrin-2/cobalt-factor-2 C20-methyltransferase
MLYSTFSYVLAGVAEICPTASIEIVPGVSSVMAAAARAQVPLATQEQRLAVLPAVYGIDDLAEVASGIDTLVLMKVSPILVQALANLEALGLKGRSTFVRRVTTARERVVYDLSELGDEDLDYFSILIVQNQVPTNVKSHQP